MRETTVISGGSDPLRVVSFKANECNRLISTTTERMEELKDLLRLLLGFAAVVVFVWLYLKVNLFSFEQGWSMRWKREPPKAEIQTLFHGNTKDDKDQI